MKINKIVFISLTFFSAIILIIIFIIPKPNRLFKLSDNEFYMLSAVNELYLSLNTIDLDDYEIEVTLEQYELSKKTQSLSLLSSKISLITNKILIVANDSNNNSYDWKINYEINNGSQLNKFKTTHKPYMSKSTWNRMHASKTIQNEIFNSLKKGNENIILAVGLNKSSKAIDISSDGYLLNQSELINNFDTMYLVKVKLK